MTGSARLMYVLDMPNTNYCEATYMEALNWSAERIDSEISSIVSFLRANCATMSSPDIQTLGREMRALRLARWA